MTKPKNIGIKVNAPKKECKDSKCPFHGNLKPRGRTFTGVVLAKDTHRTATIEWTYSIFIPKYERSETRRTKIHVHNPPCIDANVGDIVRVAETRPLSKTKNFVIIENLGKKKGFIEELAAREEATVEGGDKPEPKGEAPKEKSKVTKDQKSKELQNNSESQQAETSNEAETKEKEPKKEKKEAKE